MRGSQAGLLVLCGTSPFEVLCSWDHAPSSLGLAPNTDVLFLDAHLGCPLCQVLPCARLSHWPGSCKGEFWVCLANIIVGSIKLRCKGWGMVGYRGHRSSMTSVLCFPPQNFGCGSSLYYFPIFSSLASLIGCLHTYSLLWEGRVFTCYHTFCKVQWGCLHPHFLLWELQEEGDSWLFSQLKEAVDGHADDEGYCLVSSTCDIRWLRKSEKTKRETSLRVTVLGVTRRSWVWESYKNTIVRHNLASRIALCCFSIRVAFPGPMGPQWVLCCSSWIHPRILLPMILSLWGYAHPIFSYLMDLNLGIHWFCIQLPLLCYWDLPVKFSSHLQYSIVLPFLLVVISDHLVFVDCCIVSLNPLNILHISSLKPLSEVI